MPGLHCLEAHATSMRTDPTVEQGIYVCGLYWPIFSELSVRLAPFSVYADSDAYIGSEGYGIYQIDRFFPRTISVGRSPVDLQRETAELRKLFQADSRNYDN